MHVHTIVRARVLSNTLTNGAAVSTACVRRVCHPFEFMMRCFMDFCTEKKNAVIMILSSSIQPILKSIKLVSGWLASAT